jgi:hypothetical protein
MVGAAPLAFLGAPVNRKLLHNVQSLRKSSREFRRLHSPLSF